MGGYRAEESISVQVFCVAKFSKIIIKLELKKKYIYILIGDHFSHFLKNEVF